MEQLNQGIRPQVRVRTASLSSQEYPNPPDVAAVSLICPDTPSNDNDHTLHSAASSRTLAYDLDCSDATTKSNSPLNDEDAFQNLGQTHFLYETDQLSLLTTATSNSTASWAWGSPTTRKSFRGSNKEPKKQISSNSKKAVLLNFLILHFFAILITIILFGLYVGQQQWIYPHPTPEELSILQFAAKAHEALILMSLGDILLHRIRYGLISRDASGIPLGFLSSAFYLATPLQYLMSKEFWGTAMKPVANPRYHCTTAGLILLLIVVGIGASPLSAILMIPRLAWWPIRDAELQAVQARPPPVWYTSTNPYGLEFRNGKGADTDRGTCITQSSNFCRVQDLQPMLQNVRAFTSNPPFSPAQRNISFTNYGGLTYNRPITFALGTSAASITSVATGPMYFVALALESAGLDVWPFPTSNFLIKSQPSQSFGMRKWKQPLVAVSCSSIKTLPSLQSEILEFNFTGAFHGDFSAKIDFQSEFGSLNKTVLGNATYYAPDPIIMDLQDRVPVPISASILFVDKVKPSPETENPVPIGVNNQLCIVQARWAGADVWTSGQSMPAAQTDLGMSLEDAIPYLNRTSSNENVINMRRQWLIDIGAPFDAPTPNSTLLNTGYREALNVCQAVGFGDPSVCLPMFLSIYLTDSMTFITKFSKYEEDATDMISTPPGFEDMVLEMACHHHVYAYNFNNSTSIPLAFAILLIHAIIAITHTAIILTSSTPWHSYRWGSYGELMALALRSRAPESLHNVGGGVSSSETWSQVAIVREVISESRVEMVVGVQEECGDKTDMMLHAHPAMRHVKSREKYG